MHELDYITRIFNINLLKQIGLVCKQATQWTYENGMVITQGTFITVYTILYIPVQEQLDTAWQRWISVTLL